MFRTTTNVTGHMTVASILSRFRSRALAPAAEAAAATTLPEPTKS
jgi:Na+/H+-dicarboxylate symporter